MLHDVAMSIADRLRRAREARGFKNSSEFCAAHGLRHGSYDHHETARRGVKLPKLKIYAELLQVNLLWLAEGKGPMFKEDLESEILDLVRTMSAEQIKAWVQVGRVMTASNESGPQESAKNATKGS